MAKSKEEQIFIGVGSEVIELVGTEKEEFLKERLKIKTELDTQKAQEETQKELKISAYTKLGLTKEEMAAIL